MIRYFADLATSTLIRPTSLDRASLRHRVLKAGVITMGGYGLGQMIRFGGNLVLTRILVPEMFGVMAIAGMIMLGLALFSDLGLKANIIQSKRGDDPAFLNTAWVIQIFRGLVLWLLGLVIALLLALADRFGIGLGGAYAAPSVPPVVAALSFTAILNGFISTKLYEGSRSLALGNVVLIELATQTSNLICIFFLALAFRSIWILVAGSLCGALVTVALSHLWMPGTANRWQWDPSAFQEIFDFGKWIFLSGILGFFLLNSDRLLLGGVINATLLGVYVVAFNISIAVEQVMSRVIISVSFPALSEIAREQPHALKEKYYRVHAIVAAIAYTCSGMLMTSGQSLIGSLYDSRYTDAGWMLQILAVGLLAVPFQVSVQCFAARGLPQVGTSIQAIRLIAVFVGMPLGFHYFGLTGALWGLVLSSLLCIPAIAFFSSRYQLFDLRKELLALPAIGLGLGLGRAMIYIIELIKHF